MPGNCRILVEFEERHVRVFFCNKAGKVLDEEAFSLSEADTPEDSADRAALIHALIYDSLNHSVNGRSSSNQG